MTISDSRSAKTETEILNLLENEYLSKILGFAYLKTNSRDEAEELTQEVCLQIIEAVRRGRGRQIENIGSYIWTVANNVLCKKIKHRMTRSCLELSELMRSDEDIEDTYIKEETERSLRRTVSIMSRDYRDVVIMFYFDGLSVSEIAAKMNKPDGTVKWWLSEARKFIKDGMINMKEYGEKSYRPDTLTMSCQYNFGDNMEPVSCASRKSAQNILLAAYDKPMSIEDLSLELGISAPYIEDEVEFLTYNQLMKKTASGKYQTDFVILRSSSLDVAEKNYNASFPEYSDKLTAFLESKRDILESDEYNIGKFTWDRLLWAYIHMISSACEFRFKSEECKILTYNDIPDRPNNGHWVAIGWASAADSAPNITPEYLRGEGVYNHGTPETEEQLYIHNWSRFNCNKFFELKVNTMLLCRDIITGKVKIEDFDNEQKLIFTEAIEKNLFIKDGDTYRQNYFFIHEKQYKKLLEMSDEFYQSVIHLYRNAYKNILAKYESDVPKHLHWQMVNLLTNNMVFIPCTLYNANEKGLLSSKDAIGNEWLCMFQVG